MDFDVRLDFEVEHMEMSVKVLFRFMGPGYRQLIRAKVWPWAIVFVGDYSTFIG